LKEILFLICARAGSKGLKNKNLKKIHNISLVGHSIIAAKKLARYGKVLVTSDSQKILNISKKFGADFLIKRPKTLSGDNSPEIETWKHAVKKILGKKYNFKYVVSLPPTAPCRKIIDVINCIKKIKKRYFDFITCVTVSKKNPYFNIVKIGKNSRVELIISHKNKIKYFRRQDAPNTYDMTTVCFAAKVNYVLKTKNLLNGNVGSVLVPEERGIDIDNKFDFKIANLFLKKNN
jgi:CMP-N-acetylneuraminic acid synthetase